MLTTDEVCLLADLGRVAHDAKATLDSVRDVCLRGDVHAEGPERDFVLGELERVAGQLAAVSDLMQALYYAAPPCHLGDRGPSAISCSVSWSAWPASWQPCQCELTDADPGDAERAESEVSDADD